MLTYRIGTVSPSSQGGMAMAEYLAGEALAPDQAETDRAATAAQYYGGDAPLLSPFETLVEQLGAAVHVGEVAFSDALGELAAADTAAMTPQQRASFDDYDGREDRLTKALIEAAARADFTASPESTMPERSAMLRPDISPAVARVLGIDVGVPLTRGQIASLLNGKTATGAEIEGKKRHSAHLSAAEAFGLAPRVPVAGEALRNVLAGRRADGDVVRNAAGKELGPKAIEGLQKRVKLALGLSTKREATQAELDRLVGANEHQDPWTSAKGEVLTKWRDASGRILNLNFYERQITNTHAAVGYIDLTLSAPKGLSIAWARATDEAERAALLGVHTQAVQMTMAYGETLLGHARLGAGGSRGAEAGNIAWISYNHTTSRPAVDNERVDRHGDAYTERLSLPDAMVAPDMQLHTHSLVPNVVVTPSGRVGSIDLNRLDGVVKELGAAYQGYVARYARDLGAEVMDGVNGEAKLTAITDGEIKLFSKRTEDATRAAEAFAQSRDTDWHTLTPAGRSALVKSAAHEGRKQKEVVPEFKVWNEQAERAGYHHRSVLRPRAIKHELSDDARYEKAYEVSLRRLEAAFDKTATLDAATMRVEAMRGFVVAGISNDPGQDIASVTAMYREHGIRVDGQQTAITMVKDTVKLGRQKWLVTTELQAEMETEVITLARAAAADRSAALSVEQIDRAATEFLARNPRD